MVQLHKWKPIDVLPVSIIVVIVPILTTHSALSINWDNASSYIPGRKRHINYPTQFLSFPSIHLTSNNPG